MSSLIKAGETRITHIGYGMLVEQRWDGATWFTIRADGPLTKNIFTQEEREKTMIEWLASLQPKT